MMRAVIVTALALADSAGSWAQSPPGATPQFEVASVRQVAPVGGGRFLISGGPGTSNPGLFICTNTPLRPLLLRAYNLNVYQLTGPSWLGTKLYDITARIPPGTSKDQFNQMLQNLLLERFKLALHHETRNFAAYQLAVGKGGSRLKETSLPPRTPDLPHLRSKQRDKDGFVELTPDSQDVLGSFRDGIQREVARRTSMATLAELLEAFTGKPVLDRTGLTGLYDFRIDFSPEGLDGAVSRALASTPTQGEPGYGGPTLFGALKQLGLSLESVTAPIKVMVVDSAEQIPTDN